MTCSSSRHRPACRVLAPSSVALRCIGLVPLVRPMKTPPAELSSFPSLPITLQSLPPSLHITPTRFLPSPETTESLPSFLPSDRGRERRDGLQSLRSKLARLFQQTPPNNRLSAELRPAALAMRLFPSIIHSFIHSFRFRYRYD